VEDLGRVYLFLKTSNEMSLLIAEDPPPFDVINGDSKTPIIFVCDHAGRQFPAHLNELGLEEWVLDEHVTWDIGSGAVASCLADFFDATLIRNNYSRLVIDTNRYPDDPTICAPVSGGIAIPGNQGLTIAQQEARFEAIYFPYHQAIEDRIRQFTAEGIVPAIIAVHSCTPVFDRIVRPWHIGVLWDVDPRISIPLMKELEQKEGVCIGDNEPYSGRDPHDYTMDHHGEGNAIPHVSIEVRQDLISQNAGATYWGKLLAEALAPVLADDHLYSYLPEAERFRSA